MPFAHLPDRGALRVSGPDARSFLDGLATADMDRVSEDRARFAALLTPQGKILFDFMVIGLPEEDGGGFLLELGRGLAADLARRLAMYRLRAKVTIEDISENAGVAVIWDEAPDLPDAVTFRDPRHEGLGWRAIGPREALAALPGSDEAAWQALRISLGVPQGGMDFTYGDTFPHEANMDRLAGVDFDKGCYVGQEVVSRMQHRGTARTRIVPVRFEGAAPEAGAEVTAGERSIGHMGSAASRLGLGLARLRVDRVMDAAARGDQILAGGVPLTPDVPDWAVPAKPGEGAA